MPCSKRVTLRKQVEIKSESESEETFHEGSSDEVHWADDQPALFVYESRIQRESVVKLLLEFEPYRHIQGMS
jgi:hypothetical protein